MDGVWIEPVTAQVMMTLRALAMDLSRIDGAIVRENGRGGKLGAGRGAERATVDPARRQASTRRCAQD